MSRSLKKGYYIEESLLKRVEQAKSLSAKEKEKAVIRTWSRASSVTPEMVGLTIEVHNGKIFIKVKIVEEMVGHHLGEFAQTRKFIKHGGKLQRELEKKQQV
ncbi:MAG: 30S ribosomal protein S19 [Patescibacteria group bacterium]|nr:30S ribosomal protein S19 [Patescibacteria group bacterium]